MNKEHIKAGYDYKQNGPKTEKAQKPSPARRRRGGPLEFDSSVGIPIPNETGDFFVAKGARDRRNEPVPASAGAANFSAGRVTGVAPVPNGLSSHTSLYNSSPAQNSNFVFSRSVGGLLLPQCHEFLTHLA